MSEKVSTRSKPAKDALIEAARSEFSEKGYAGATTREIARRAGVNEVMLFRHFQSKSNLFMEAVFRPLDEHILAFTKNHISNRPNPELSSSSWQIFSGELFRFLSENRSLFVALIASSTSEGSNSKNVKDLTSLDEYFIHATEALTLSMTSSDRSRLGNPAIIVRLTFSLVAAMALFRDLLFPEDQMQLDDVFEVMCRFVDRGFGMVADASAPERD